MIISPFKSRKPGDFRILLFYPNLHMSALMPQSIGIFTAILKREGYKLDLFDCTYYEDIDAINLGKNAQKERIENRNAPVFSENELHKKGVSPKRGIENDFNKKIDEFQPDLILCSVLESTYYLAMMLLESVPKNKRRYKTLFGGVFATYASEKIIKSDLVDYICRGEWEEAIQDFCHRLSNGERRDNVKNVTIKADGQIFRNTLRPAVDIESVPIPDWDLFEEGSLYRPMQGKIWRAVGLETQRGCPYTCAYCNSPANNLVYKNEVNKIFYRKKSIPRLKQELDFLVKKYDPQLIYFVVDTFLAMSNREFDEKYRDYSIPADLH